MKETIYYVSGMHCGACEILVEQKLLDQRGVAAGDASVGNGTIRIEHEGRIPSVTQLEKWFKSDGYTFSETKIKHIKEPLIYFIEGKGVQVDKSILKRRLKTFWKVGLVFFVLYLIERSGVAHYITVTENSSFAVFFLFGIVAGLSSCAALVGGILLSLAKGWNEQLGYKATPKQKMRPHITFHMGRLVAYAVFGAVLGAFGSTVSFDNITIYALITIAVSVIMFVIGLQMAGVAWADKFQIRMPKFITRKVASDSADAGGRMPAFIGMGTVLLPCGFTLIAQGVALTSGSAIRGAFILCAFALGTMIPLLFIGYTSAKGTNSAKRGRTFSFYAGVVLVIFALYNINGQMNVLGYPSVSDIFVKEQSATAGTTLSAKNQGEQIISMVAQGFSYTLTSANVIQAGVPTKLVVDDQGIRGCGVFLSARGLMNGFVDLKYGENIIDLGKPKKGVYKITCSMGMVPPVTIHVE